MSKSTKPGNTGTHPTAGETAEFVPFGEFAQGLPMGRFHVVVNPRLVVPFVSWCTHATAVALALIGPGIACALYGYPWAGIGLVLAGVLMRMTVKRKATSILLHLTARVPTLYEKATQSGVMEVQRR